MVRPPTRGTLDLQLTAFVKRYNDLRGDDLIADTYRRFPFFAIRSEISERVLKGDTAALARIAALRTNKNAPTLSTIGYEGHSLESYLNTLLRSGVTLLCDVRRNPISRKYGFSKSTLANVEFVLASGETQALVELTTHDVRPTRARDMIAVRDLDRTG